jgi:uncharacterized protein (TIGR02300 family)
MAKPEWGVKRTCQGCGAKFYDMQKTPAVCPKCDVEFVEEVVTKGRRKRTAKVVEATAKVEAVVDDEVVPDADDVDGDDDLDLDIEDDDDDDLMALADDDDDDDDDVEAIKGIKVEKPDKEE